MAKDGEQVKQEPTAGRPDLPRGYGIPEDIEGLVAWGDVTGWLEQTKVFWIGTTSPDGRPHAVPIWGAWLDGKFFFEGSPSSLTQMNHKVERQGRGV